MPADSDPSDDNHSCLQGRLVRQRIDTGSKSERPAMLLELGNGHRMLLRRRGGHPIRDPELEALEGQVLRVRGEQRDGYFLAHDITPLDDLDQQPGER